jgi:hypothetical protein
VNTTETYNVQGDTGQPAPLCAWCGSETDAHDHDVEVCGWFADDGTQAVTRMDRELAGATA